MEMARYKGKWASEFRGLRARHVGGETLDKGV